MSRREVGLGKMMHSNQTKITDFIVIFSIFLLVLIGIIAIFWGFGYSKNIAYSVAGLMILTTIVVYVKMAISNHLTKKSTDEVE